MLCEKKKKTVFSHSSACFSNSSPSGPTEKIAHPQNEKSMAMLRLLFPVPLMVPLMVPLLLPVLALLLLRVRFKPGWL